MCDPDMPVPNDANEKDGVLLIQFAREPVAGRVKTRLLPAVSAQEACEIHSQLVRQTNRTLLQAAVGPVELYVAGDTEHALFTQCIKHGVAGVHAQRGEGLGERMVNALHSGLGSYSAVVLVGSDCPVLDERYLQTAVEALHNVDVVVGPAADGGYVLIGVRCLNARWFEGVEWGGSEVFSGTVARLRETRSSYRLLPTLWDVDRPEDLVQWRQLQHSGTEP